MFAHVSINSVSCGAAAVLESTPFAGVLYGGQSEKQPYIVIGCNGG